MSKATKKMKKAELEKASSPKAEVKAEVKKAVKAEVRTEGKIGNYVIKDCTNEFSLNRLESGSGKRHYVLLTILSQTQKDIKAGCKIVIKDCLALKDTLKGKTEIAYGLIGKYNRFLIANELPIRVKAQGVAVEGKKVLMAKSIEVYIPVKA